MDGLEDDGSGPLVLRVRCEHGARRYELCLRSFAAVDHTTDGTSDGKAWSKDLKEG